MDKLKSGIKEYLGYFKTKRISIILGIVVITYIITTLGDVIQEKDLPLEILETCLYLISMFTMTIVTIIHSLWKAIKKKELKLLELLANYTTLMIYFTVIGGLVNVMVSKNIWIIRQRRDIFLNGLEYALSMLVNMFGLTVVTVIIIVITLIVRAVKRSRRS